MAGNFFDQFDSEPAAGVIQGPPRLPSPQTDAQARKDVVDLRRAEGEAAELPLRRRKLEAEVKKAEIEANPLAQQDLDAIRMEAIDKIKLARSLKERSKGWFTTGFGAKLAAAPGGTEAYDVAADTETLKNAGALQRIMEMAKTNGGKNPLTPLSNSDFQALASSLSNLDTSQSDEQFQRNVDRVEQLYLRAYQGAGGGDLEADLNGPAKPPIDPAGTGDIGFNQEAPVSPFTPQQQAAYDAFLTANPQANADQLRAFGATIGVSVENADEIIAARAQGAGVQPGSSAIINVPEVKRAGGALSTIGSFSRGVADTATLGFRDELAAAGQTIFGDGTMAENLAFQRAVDESDEENNGGARITGQIAGGLALPSGVGGVGRAAAIAALRNGATRAEALAAAARAVGTRAGMEGAGYGAGYGAGSTEGDLGDRTLGAASGAAIGGTVGALAGYGGQRFATRGQGGQPPTRPGARPPADGETAADVMDAADKLDIQMLPADTGGAGTRFATSVANMSLGGIPLSQAATKSVGSAGAARDRISGTLGAVMDETGAGQTAKAGANRWIAATKTRGGQLFERVPVPQDRRVVLTNTRTALNELTQGMESNPELSRMVAENPRLKGFLDALTIKTEPVYKSLHSGGGGPATARPIATAIDGGQLSWADMKRFRSIIGEIIGQPGLAEDTSTASLRKLYAGLSGDMEATAAATGPKALDAWKKANRYWRGREDRINNVLSDILGTDLAKGDQPAFAQIERWAQKSGGDATKLGRALRSLDPDEVNTVRASLLGKMGRASAGRQDEAGAVFSPAEFVTQWNKLSNRAKSQLFGSTEHKAAINDLAKVMARMKRAEQFANVSRTALAGNGLALFATAFSSPFGALAIGGSQLAAGKMLASPRFARWLAQAPGQRSASATRAHLRRLTIVAQRDPAISQDILGLQQRLLTAFNDNVAPRAAASGDERQRDEQ